MSRFRHPSLAGKVSQQVQAEKRMANPPDYIPRPLPGMLLKTIRVTDELQGCSFEIKIRQGTRLNQIVAETFGRKANWRASVGRLMLAPKASQLDWPMKSL
jgi:hypothetical protein